MARGEWRVTDKVPNGIEVFDVVYMPGEVVEGLSEKAIKAYSSTGRIEPVAGAKSPPHTRAADDAGSGTKETK